MGELFRSEPMQLVQLFMSLEAARDTVDELGEIGLIQFKDVRSLSPLPLQNCFRPLSFSISSLYYQPASFTPWKLIKWKRLIANAYIPLFVCALYRTRGLWKIHYHSVKPP
jgi:hypothetical protein